MPKLQIPKFHRPPTALILGLLLAMAANLFCASEPTLFRSTIRIEPTIAQVETTPASQRTWRLHPPLAARLADVLKAGTFPETFSTAVLQSLITDPVNGDGAIHASVALLELLPKSKRLTWWAILSAYDANRAYRWPIALRTDELDQMETDPRFAEAVKRIQLWGVAEGPRILFADFFTLDDAFPDRPSEIAFFQNLLSANTEFLKLVADTTDPAAIESNATYWDPGSRNREIEPFLSAIAHVSGHDRIDIAHLLPRLPRSLLYTYPPSFQVVEEPSVENAAMAAAFFTPSIDTENTFPQGFSAWLASECESVTGPREYGDIIVFEDPSLSRWPFSMVYIADDIVFGRRPTLYGPWEFLPENQIRNLNPKLRGGKTSIFRPRSIAQNNSPNPFTLPKQKRTQLESLPTGPWGNLKSYDILLSPSDSLLSSLPEPSAQPVWKFHNTSATYIRASIAQTDMPAQTRQDLLDLFNRAKPDRKSITTVHPSSELVLATPPALRETLFAKMVHGSNAADYAQDFYIPTQLDAADWFTSETLSDHTRDLILRLVYKHSNSLRLSDYGTFYHAISPAERLTAIKTLMSTPAMILLMERPALEDVSTLANYWRIDQQKSIPRLLESFAKSEDMTYLDITHLLPPLARELSNLYARAAYDTPTPSCYWSALNFEADQPDSRLLVVPSNPTESVPLVWQKLRRDYRRATKAERIGDLVTYQSRATGDILHICAFVAADIVFTKNGYGSSSPWCLMRLNDVDALYLDQKSERLAYQKIKKTAPPNAPKSQP